MDGIEPATQAPAPRATWRTMRGRWSRSLTLAIVAAALLGAIALIFETIETERAQRAHIARTNEVLGELRNISRAALNAETAQRGYVITLDRRYLQPYYLGREQYRPAIRRLHEHLGEGATPRQAELVDRIENLAETKFGELEDSIDLVQRGDRNGAERLLLTDEGLEAMERLRLAIREMEAIEQADLEHASQISGQAEGRVLPLLFGLLALVLVTLWLGLRLSARAGHAEAEAAQAAALAEARDRADLLARELNHRVKNLFAVILAIVRMTGKDDPQARPVIEKVAERIHALSTAHEVTQGPATQRVASLRTLLETTVRPYLTAGRKAEFAGPTVSLSAKQVTPLGLVLHELTTNAVKYGCWQSDGTLHVDWRADGETVELVWREDGAGCGTEPARQGFGSLLMKSAAKQLRGSIERTFTADGMRVTISMPAAATG